MIDPWELLEKASDRAHFQAESVGICLGHMTNAIIDLQSGETKATAIATLKRGIGLIEQRQAPIREHADSIRGAAIADTHPKDGDVKQTPLVSGGGAQSAIAQPEYPKPSPDIEGM